jgi:hypothetical protein
MPRNETIQRRGATGSGDGSADPKAAVQSAVDEAKGAVDEASSTVSEAASGVREAVGDLASEVQTIAADAGDKARSFAEENKGRAAEQISGITSAIGKAADELEARGQGQFAKYTRDLVSGLEGLSRNLNENGVDEIMGSVGQFARNQPAAFLGAAALLGFVSSRFAMSTAKPQPQPQASSTTSMAYGYDGGSSGAPSYRPPVGGPARDGSAVMGEP